MSKLLFIPAVLLAPAGAISAQTWRHEPVAPAAVTGFGSAITFAGAELLIGRTGLVAGFPMPPSQTGAVHVFRRGADGSWSEAATVASDDAKVGDAFGTSLSADGAWLAVGAPSAGTGGAVYLFERRNGRWTQAARLTLPDGAGGDQFGQVVALAGSRLLVGAPGRDSARGAVYGFRRAASGSWDAAGQVARGGAAGDRLGAAVALDGDAALVGAPGPIQLGSASGGKPGSAVVYRAGAPGAWTEEARLTPGDSAAGFGAAVAFIGGEAVVGAPLTGRGAGAAYAFRRDGARWTLSSKVQPRTPVAGSTFGMALAGTPTALFVGGPFGNGLAGTVMVFAREGAAWVEKQQLTQRAVGLGGLFGMAIGVAGDEAVIGGPFAEFFEGAGYAYRREATGEWRSRGTVVDKPAAMAAVGGADVRCADGKAAGFDCQQVDLLAFVPTAALGAKRGIMLNDIWGWTDAASGREFALVGRMDGTAFVEVTNPNQPRYVGELPLHQGATPNLWRDIKVYKDHAYIVADNAGPHGVQVFDLRQLLTAPGPNPVTFTETAHYDKIASAHNIAINEESGFAYPIGNSGGGETCGGALHMIDIREPANPKFAGCYADKSTGNARTGYTHDTQCVTYKGPDGRYQGREICFNASETALGIADVTDKANPKPVAVGSYPNTNYAHQGWLSEDHRYFYLDDEGDELSGAVPRTRTLVWDVTKLDEPVVAKEFLGTTAATDHNLYVRGRYMFQSNYVSGLRVIDITDPVNPKETGFFDTVPTGENVPGFAGSWSNFPYFPSGTIVVTSMKEGLFIVRHRPTQLVP